MPRRIVPGEVAFYGPKSSIAATTEVEMASQHGGIAQGLRRRRKATVMGCTSWGRLQATRYAEPEKNWKD